MARERRVIDADGVERIVSKLDREDVQLEEGSKDQIDYERRARRWRIAFYTLLALGGCFFIFMLVWGSQMLIGGDPDRKVKQAPPKDESLNEHILSADEVARAFLDEPNAENRLLYVRDVETIREHMKTYPEEALSFPAEEIKPIGHSVASGRAESAYAVRFANGRFRMLSVVETEQGPKVDWDCYARYCSATWEELFSGRATEAEVRVFVRPGDYHVGQFRDRRQWTCFLLVTPDNDRSIYAYAKAGSDMGKRMQASVMKNRSFRQQMTLKIKSHDGSGKDALFVVDQLLAIGWVVMDQ